MKLFISLCVLFFVNDIYAKSFECHSLNSGVELKIEETYEIAIRDRIGCDFDVGVVKNIDNKNSTGVIIGPSSSELSSNAQNSIYIKQAGRKSFSFAGNLPVGAEKISKGKYKYIEQEGGGVYLTFYLIKDNRVVMSTESKTLLIDGRYCIDFGEIKNINDMKNDATCNKKVSASFQNSICIFTSKNRAKIMPTSNCFDLRK